MDTTNSSLAVVARGLAAAAHKGQKYGTLPYTRHCSDVVGLMDDILSYETMEFYSKEIGLAAGWLHDTVEDTWLTLDAIEHALGRPVARLVGAVTDAPGANRYERKKNTYPKIRATGPMAVALKLADRIANIEYGISTKDVALTRMYRKEQDSFAGALYRPDDGLDRAWARLDALLKAKP